MEVANAVLGLEAGYRLAIEGDDQLKTAIDYPGPAAVRYPRGSGEGVPMDPDIKANFERGLPPEVLVEIHWYPTVPPGLEEMEGRTLDRVNAAN